MQEIPAERSIKSRVLVAPGRHQELCLAAKLRVMCLHLNVQARKETEARGGREMQAELSGQGLCQAAMLQECSGGSSAVIVTATQQDMTSIAEERENACPRYISIFFFMRLPKEAHVSAYILDPVARVSARCLFF